MSSKDPGVMVPRLVAGLHSLAVSKSKFQKSRSLVVVATNNTAVMDHALGPHPSLRSDISNSQRGMWLERLDLDLTPSENRLSIGDRDLMMM
jgi:hypothetical protein